ncbi:MAG: homocysteine S-methyltransferase family protein [Myxococcota bacterium]
MTPKKYRNDLPQLGDARLLTDGGLETTLVFHQGLELPLFAAFHVLRSSEGQDALKQYYRPYIEIAHAQSRGFVMDSATWRASQDWGERLGYSAAELDRANRSAVRLLFELRDEFEKDQPFVISGTIGPRGDGYVAGTGMTPSQSEAYHAKQIASLDEAGVDMVSAVTMTHSGEAKGIARACSTRGLPLALSFTVETDGRLPSGQPLGEAIEEVDEHVVQSPTYYMINCAHPDHFVSVLGPDAAWKRRIRGVRANASRCSHAELDASEELDEGDPMELAQGYVGLMSVLPELRVFGGCCGTDHRHVRAIAELCLRGSNTPAKLR